VASYPGQNASCLVSGGLDSSIVALLARERFADVTLHSIGSDTNNEFAAASKLSESLRLPLRYLRIDEGAFLTALAEVVSLVEHCSSTFIEYLVPVHLAHGALGPGTSLVLSGYGSDILFGGFARGACATRQVADLIRHEYASTTWSNEASQTLGGYHGFTVGYPFFDSRVVDLAMAIDPRLKHRGTIEKFILRRAFAEALPAEIAWRPKLGVHEATGCEAFYSSLLPAANEADRRRQKDVICYAVLAACVAGEASPEDLDVARMFATPGTLCPVPAPASICDV
jgi:asparagine synthetase B (glutamine-hydrolysing)